MDQSSQTARAGEGSSIMQPLGADQGGHLIGNTDTDKAVQNLAQDVVTSKEVTTTTTAAAAPDMATRTVVTMHTTTVQSDDEIISSFFDGPDSLLLQVRKEDKNNYFEYLRDEELLANIGILDDNMVKFHESLLKSRFNVIGGMPILSVEQNKLRKEMDNHPETRKLVISEIKRYKNDPHCIDHPVLAAVCANCPILLDMFLKSIYKDKESLAYTLDRAGSHNNSTPLVKAVETGDVELVGQLFRAGAKSTTEALMVAVKSDKLAPEISMLMVRKLIMSGARPDDLIMEIASRNKNQEIIDFLNKVRAPSVPIPADTYKAMREIDIELLYAVRLGNIQRVKEAMEGGANPNVMFYNPKPEDSFVDSTDKNHFSDTALYWAIRNWKEKKDTILINTLQLLNPYRDVGQSEYQTNDRDRLLHGLVRATIPGLVTRQEINDLKTKLMALNISIPQAIEAALTANENRDKTLMLAVKNKHKEYIDQLLEAEANPAADFPLGEDPYGDTAVYCAIRNWEKREDTALVNMLLRFKHKLNDRDKNLYTLVRAVAFFLYELKTKIKINEVKEAEEYLNSHHIEIPKNILDALMELKKELEE